MEEYRTEEEQVEALKKWWEENGRSTIVAIIVALGIGFGWQGWKKYQQDEIDGASNSYQSMLQQMGAAGPDGEQQEILALGESIKLDYSRSTYAQFAALHLARLAVSRGDLKEAEAQLRWVLGRADKGSDQHQLAQLRLARVLASGGDAQQALAILDGADGGSYQAAYAVARGDILLMQERNDEAREAYSSALLLAASGGKQVNLGMLQQKLQSLSPVPPQEVPAVVVEEAVTELVEEAVTEDVASEPAAEPVVVEE